MNLPIKILDAPTLERVISVDGAWNQPGLSLSHWPGNQTPPELKHDLSTGIALNFARLDAARQAELAAGCTALANNHVDTDGVCALFAVRQPELALARADQLLEAAAAGDFFRVPSERAFQLDCTLNGCFDAQRSPWSTRFAGLDDHGRREFVARQLVETLDTLLDADLQRFAELWTRELERLRADQRALALAAREDLVHFDLSIWTGDARFAPGRHALFGSTAADRALCVGAGASGATYRLIVNTTSWFDLASPKRLPRPALETLCAELNEREGTSDAHECAWRTHPTLSPAPELWFGTRGAAFFAEHSRTLAPSRLAPRDVRAVLVDALRAAWVFPEA